MIRYLAPFFIFLATTLASGAQELASLVADTIRVSPDGQVTATGNVEVYYNGTRLTARSISYSSNGDRLTIEGPIRVVEPNGTVLIAAMAELDRDLSDGILHSARMVLDRQLQMAASEIARVGDRYTRLDRVVASSCEVCASNPTPLWEIRADQVLHDQQERQIYFTNARLRLAGVAVMYLPRLRLPDPTLKRARGFLTPRLRTSSELGTGLKLPYFIPIGAHADVTLTPYFSTKTSTVELSFRQNVKGGEILAEGAITRDDIDGTRGYLFANASFLLPKDFLLSGQFEFVSDPGYLFTYNYADKDRLTNEISATRFRGKDRFRASATEFRTLRASEVAIRDTLPDRFIEVLYQREITELSFGGRTTASIETAALNRPSSDNILGRDVSRIGSFIDWRADRVIGPGIVAAGEIGLRFDAYNVEQDDTFANRPSRFVPRGAFELRWPLGRTTADGGSEVLEPVFRFDIADASGNRVPLEDSTVVEFDEANLFSHTRYPGIDGVEDGARAAVGLAWRRSDPGGWTVDFALGRLAHLDGDLGFAEGSGLEGDRSEWLFAARLYTGNGLFLANRSLFDENIDFTLSETRVAWNGDRHRLASNYIFAAPEPAEGRNDDLSEWSLEGEYDLNDRWTASAEWRYDFATGREARTGIGLGYRSDCIDVEFSASRRYANSESVDPTTDFGFRVSLTGVGSGSENRPRSRSCRG